MPKPIVRKRRTREHIIADLSVNHFERQALLCGFSVERVWNDYGYDLLLFTYDAHGERETGEVYVQVKATETISTIKNGTMISWRLLRADLASWLFSSVPVILVVYDAQNNQAYWLYIQRYFHALSGFNLFAAGKTVTARIPTRHVLDPAAIRQFAQFRDALTRQTQGLIKYDA